MTIAKALNISPSSRTRTDESGSELGVWRLALVDTHDRGQCFPLYKAQFAAKGHHSTTLLPYYLPPLFKSMDPTAIVNTGLTPTISLWEYVRNRYSIRLNLTQSEEALAEATQLIYVILHTEEECARYPPERLREMQEWYNE